MTNPLNPENRPLIRLRKGGPKSPESHAPRITHKPYTTTLAVQVQVDPEAYELAYGEPFVRAEATRYAVRLVQSAVAGATLPEWLTVEYPSV